jgi:hypothetical protein
VPSPQRGAARWNLNGRSPFLHACAAVPALRTARALRRVSLEQRETTPSLNCDGSPGLRATKKPGSSDPRASHTEFPDSLRPGAQSFFTASVNAGTASKRSATRK